MELILREDVEGLGRKGDLVQVKPGYGRNFLIPQQKAVCAHKGNKRSYEELLRQAARREDFLREQAKSLAEKLSSLSLSIRVRASEEGKLFGAITPLQVSDALKEQGFEIDKKQISIPKLLKEVGEHKILLNLHKDLSVEVALSVQSEEEEKAS
ncbi:MAG: 50S ribosomal protein L9 [Cytophagales bacterium]|nr:50S ribosomal protein L9 [Cytophagales bacterium]